MSLQSKPSLAARDRALTESKANIQKEQNSKRPSTGFRVIYKVITIVDGCFTKILPAESRRKPTRDNTHNNRFDDCSGAVEQ
jgi:hypothetical protein